MDTNPFGITPGYQKFYYVEDDSSKPVYYLEVQPFRNSGWYPINSFDTFEEAMDRINCATRTPAHYRIINSTTKETFTFTPEQVY